MHRRRRLGPWTSYGKCFSGLTEGSAHYFRGLPPALPLLRGQSGWKWHTPVPHLLHGIMHSPSEHFPVRWVGASDTLPQAISVELAISLDEKVVNYRILVAPPTARASQLKDPS